jgi:ribonuclease T2
MARTLFRLFFSVCLLAALPGLGRAQGLQGGVGQTQKTGGFDFYVLALSWAPSFCAATGERSRGREPGLECGLHGYSFVVHGLWPQYQNGFPQYCQVPAPHIDRGLVSSMLDLMPSPRLVFSEWDRHGTCSGLSPRAYFATIRKARAQVKIPPEFLHLRQPLTTSPAAVQNVFLKANPDLAAGDIAVECGGSRLTEIRLCMSKELGFRACPQIVRRSCRRDRLVMPPVHGTPADTVGGSG